MNSGDAWPGFHGGPTDLASAKSHVWPRIEEGVGVCWWRSDFSFAQIVDGTSNTLLFGEKSMDPLLYDSWYGGGDACDMYEGQDLETNRFAGPDYPLHVDTPGLTDTYGYGGPHPGGCLFALCDGSVRSIAYTVDTETYRRMALRADGEVVNWDEL
jgi:hypothetical protein